MIARVHKLSEVVRTARNNIASYKFYQIFIFRLMFLSLLIALFSVNCLLWNYNEGESYANIWMRMKNNNKQTIDAAAAAAGWSKFVAIIK